MVDEFIYQFQSFAQYRGKLAQKSPHELELLKKCEGVWDLQGVLHYLQGLIDKSNILRELSSDGECCSLLSLSWLTPLITSLPMCWPGLWLWLRIVVQRLHASACAWYVRE